MIKNFSEQETTFNELPGLVSELYRKVSRMERMLENITPNQEAEDKPMDLDECSRFIGLAKPTIYTKVNKKEIPHHKISKKLYFYKEELTEWIKNGKTNPNPVSALKTKKGASHG